MDASRELPGGHEDFSKTLPEADIGMAMQAMPLHPHNAILQWQVELGLPGTLLGLAIVLWGLGARYLRRSWNAGPAPRRWPGPPRRWSWPC